jgi:hypothetical protein
MKVEDFLLKVYKEIPFRDFNRFIISFVKRKDFVEQMLYYGKNYSFLPVN